MFPCQCGHGFLRKVEDQDTTVNQGNTARKKKKQNEKPKLNSKPKPLSQKGVAEYFSEASEKVSIVRRTEATETQHGPASNPTD